MSALAAEAPPTIRPEHELLLCCARTELDAGRADRVKELARDELDWDYLLRAARRHQIRPLLYRHLNATCPEAVPEARLSQLRDGFQETARRNLHVTAELSRMMKLFEAHGVAAVPFKGPLLTTSVYGNLAFREFGDLDILIDERDVAKAMELALSQGYRPNSDETVGPLTGRRTRAQLAALLASDCEYAVVRNEDRLLLEIHWRFVPRKFPFSLNSKLLRGRLQKTSVAGREFQTLSAEDLLLVVCVHSAKHLWVRLKWVCDVAELVRVHSDMDWLELIGQATRLGSQRMLFLGLFLAKTLLGASIPESVWQRAQAEPGVESLAAEARDLLFREFPGPPGYGLPGYYDRSLFYVRAMERLRDKARYWFRFVTTPTEEEFEVLSLPDWLFPLYYLLRPLRMGRWFSRWVWRRMRGWKPALEEYS